MKHLFIPYELALIAKEKGFNEPCLATQVKSANPVIQNYPVKNSTLESMIPSLVCAVFYQQIVDWFREKHQIFIDIQTDQTSYPKYAYELSIFTGNPKDLTEKEWGWNQIKRMQWGLHRDYYENFNAAIEEAFSLIK